MCIYTYNLFSFLQSNFSKLIIKKLKTIKINKLVHLKEYNCHFILQIISSHKIIHFHYIYIYTIACYLRSLNICYLYFSIPKIPINRLNQIRQSWTGIGPAKYMIIMLNSRPSSSFPRHSLRASDSTVGHSPFSPMAATADHSMALVFTSPLPITI